MVLPGLKIHVFIKCKQNANRCTFSFTPVVEGRKSKQAPRYLFFCLGIGKSRVVFASQTARLFGYVKRLAEGVTFIRGLINEKIIAEWFLGCLI